MFRTLALIIIMAAPASLRAGESADQLTAAGIAGFRAAYQSWDGAGFERAAELFRRAGEKKPGSVVPFYWLGAARFHRMLHARNLPPSKTNTQTAEAAMDGAVDALETAVRLNAGHAESHALLGTLYGMKIHGGMLRAIRYGPSVQEHQKLALQLGPRNPRVRYLLGTGQFHLAKDAAARREALNTLLEAEKLFAAEAATPAKPFDPRWGRASCLTFIGRACESLGQHEQAADYFRRALAMHPADHHAKDGLARVTSRR
jgi:tetratricopeptide (TPR) repeat protein